MNISIRLLQECVDYFEEVVISPKAVISGKQLSIP